MNDAPRYSIDDLCQLTGLTRRTIRFYIQSSLLARPHGERRGAWYGSEHLERLIAIRKWTSAGLSLEGIAALLADASSEIPPLRPLRAGTVEVRSHLTVAAGVDVVVSPERTRLTPEQLRDFLQRVGEVYEAIQMENKNGYE